MDLQAQLDQGYQVLEKSLPEDISEIYLASLPEPSAA
jgi:glycyl-tRNA synthetase alpha subunit